MDAPANNYVLFCKINSPYGEFSNWYHAPFKVDGKTFNNCEEYMMYKKAHITNAIPGQSEQNIAANTAIMAEILEHPSPARVKELGRKVKGYDEKTWANCRYSVVLDANRMKFFTHKNLAKKLLDTGTRTIAEAADYDKVWGIGLGPNDPRAQDEKQWLGQNLLGLVLMGIRGELAKVMEHEMMGK